MPRSLKKPHLLLLPLLLLIIGGLVGLYISNISSSADINKNVLSNNIDPGWKSYCSDYGYLCLSYPQEWNIINLTTEDESTSPETTTFTSPSGKITVVYRPNFGIRGQEEANIMSVISVDKTKAEDLQVVSLVTQYNGSGILDEPYSPETFVTNNLQSASSETFAAGVNVASSHEPVFHTFVPRNNSKITSYLYVKYNQDVSRRSTAKKYASYDETLLALQSSEAQTARRILQSVSYRE